MRRARTGRRGGAGHLRRGWWRSTCRSPPPSAAGRGSPRTRASAPPGSPAPPPGPTRPSSGRAAAAAPNRRRGVGSLLVPRLWTQSTQSRSPRVVRRPPCAPCGARAQARPSRARPSPSPSLDSRIGRGSIQLTSPVRASTRERLRATSVLSSRPAGMTPLATNSRRSAAVAALAGGRATAACDREPAGQSVRSNRFASTAGACQVMGSAPPVQMWGRKPAAGPPPSPGPWPGPPGPLRPVSLPVRGRSWS